MYENPTDLRLTEDEAAHLTGTGARMDGYYVSFSPTGDHDIDAILSALAWAGKAVHHTSGWNDPVDVNYGPYRKDGRSPEALIQAAANTAAENRRNTQASKPSPWPETAEERVLFADWQYEVSNGDTVASFRDWMNSRALDEEN